MATMRAAQIEGFGPPEVLQLVEVERPTPGPRDLLVRIHATSVNPVDAKVRSGTNRAVLPPRLPWILGLDLSGVVEAVGSEVTEFAVGDAVYGSPTHKRPGTYAEYIAVDAGEVVRKPESLSHAEAASMPLVFQTAWDCLVRKGKLGPGQTVLVQAASGGVGTMAVQLGRHLQARVVGTCSERNAELVLSLGADEVIDYRSTDFAAVLSEVDLVLDGLTWETQTRSLPVLRRGGRLVSIASGLPTNAKIWGPYLGVLVTAASMGWLSIRGLLVGRKVHHVVRSPDAGVLEALNQLIAIGSVRPVVDREFALDEIAAAHAYSETGRARGKIVVGCL